jgi:hypothetical protein
MSLELIIAIYGAVLATILAVIEIRKERKKITIILEYVTIYERAQILITNSGHRSITLTNMTMKTKIKDREGMHWEAVPQNALYDTANGMSPFPLTIKDGESVSIPLGTVVTDYLLENKLMTNLAIFDSEGNSYTKYEPKILDGKWGGYYYQ